MGRQNRKLIENLKRYEEKETKQSESKIYGQKPVKGKTNKEKSISVWNKRSKSIRYMV